ncbi:MAG: hypothetical protein H8D67_14825 [Deltaproteobacteria bacterium]|nr:hypothetical protein [Deltaproteobacteria bacterium]
MELWAVVLENKNESGGEVKAVSFLRSNLLKQTKGIKKEAKAWQSVEIRKIELYSESEPLLSYAVNQLIKGVI